MAVTVDVEGGDLVVRVTGWDVVWGMSRGLRVPLHEVRDASVVPRDSLGTRREAGRRGSRVTGVLKSGWYAGRGWSEFWVTRWPDHLLVVTCAPEARYDRLVLDVVDPTPWPPGSAPLWLSRAARRRGAGHGGRCRRRASAPPAPRRPWRA